MERRCWVNFQCRGVLLVWMIVGQGPIALAVGAGGGCLDIFSLIYLFSFLSPSLWETARYRLKYCLKGPLNPKQPTNQPSFSLGEGPFSTEILSQRAVKPKTTNPSYLDNSRTRAFCAFSRCECGLLGYSSLVFHFSFWGWSGGAMALRKLPVPGRPTN